MLELVLFVQLAGGVALGLLLWLLHAHLEILTRLERRLGLQVWSEQPETPVPAAGTTFVLGDAEVASRERQLQAESLRRTASRRPLPPSAGLRRE